MWPDEAAEKLVVTHQNQLGVAYQNQLGVAHQNQLGVAHQNQLEVAHQNQLEVAHQNQLGVAHQNQLEVAHQNQFGGTPKPVRGQAIVSGYHWLQKNSVLLAQPCGFAHTQLSESIASGPDTYFLWFSSDSRKWLAATQCPPLYSQSASVRSGFLSGAGCQLH